VFEPFLSPNSLNLIGKVRGWSEFLINAMIKFFDGRNPFSQNILTAILILITFDPEKEIIANYYEYMVNLVI